MNLSEIFELVNCGETTCFYRACCGKELNFLYIELLIGEDSMGQLSVPENVNLNLNEYSHLTFGFNGGGSFFTWEKLQNLFGDIENKRNFNFDSMNTREDLLKVLEKLGFSFMPDDAGDGE